MKAIIRIIMTIYVFIKEDYVATVNKILVELEHSWDAI